MTINKMLLPVALEPRDSKVLAYGCGLQVQGVRELLVAHVVDSSGQEAPVIVAEVERSRERLREMVAPFLDCGMAIETRVVTGTTFREIMALAHQVHVDVILCGTEGKSFVDYIFSGSISEDLALRGGERTMTVRYELLDSVPDAAELAHDFGKNLVVPTDFSSSALRALLSVFNRPSEAMGTLHLLHVLGDGFSRADADAQMRAMSALADEHGAKLVVQIREGDPAGVILDYVNEVDATGIITGRRGRSQLGRGLLGSVSMQLLRDAPCPVVIQP
jgi:nucleotide-binding universal stress UspA family protein